MKILFLSAVLPYPLYSGGQIRIYHLLRAAAQKHDITLFAFVRQPQETAYLKQLSFCRQIEIVVRGHAWQPKYVARSVLGEYPFLLTTYSSKEMYERLHQVLTGGKYDLVHLEPFYVWPSLPATPLPLVVAEHNIEYQVYEDYVRHSPWVVLRPFMYADVLKLRFWEEYVWRKASHLTAVSPGDRAVIASQTKTPVTVVSNGVDLATYKYKADRPQHSGPVLLFVGNFAWLPNCDAVRKLVFQIWPLVRERFSQAKLRIVGRNVPSWLQKLRAQPLGLSVEENVASIIEKYHQADVLVAPIAIAGGTKFKILEAMASGLPVVASSEAVGGLKANPEVHYLPARDAREYATQIIKIWQNKKLGSSLIQRARELVEEYYSWEQIADRLGEVWQRTYEKAQS